MLRGIRITYLLLCILTCTANVMLTCDDARNAFCSDCHHDLKSHDASLCTTILNQCKKSFCKPLCLKLGWKVSVDVDCTGMEAENLKQCTLLSSQVQEAAGALSAQLQGYACSSVLNCCTDSAPLVDWVENHVYADKYPDAHVRYICL